MIYVFIVIFIIASPLIWIKIVERSIQEWEKEK